MSSKALAIRARGLSKSYRMYRQPADVLREVLTRRQHHYTVTALDQVDLDLYRGEMVGVLGRNGAGKSTLLKIIAGTLDRTAGELDVFGRVTAILELGTGFHPEHSGRRNVYMGGMCLGMKRAEIDAKIDSIIEFSELGDVIDQPFKTYSTGMQARLTFSTAISVEPDIMIIDEALAVGDARFQMKCFSRLKELREKETTILLVSHDTNTINTLCDRALILEHGRVVSEGEPKQVSHTYLSMLFGDKGRQRKFAAPRGAVDPEGSQPASADQGQGPDRGLSPEPAHTGSSTYGNNKAQIISFGLKDEGGAEAKLLEAGQRCRVFFTARFLADVENISFGFRVVTPRGVSVYGTSTDVMGIRIPPQKAGDVYKAEFAMDLWLAAGDFFLTLGIAANQGSEILQRTLDAYQFRVESRIPCYTDSVANLGARFRGKQRKAGGG